MLGEDEWTEAGYFGERRIDRPRIGESALREGALEAVLRKNPDAVNQTKPRREGGWQAHQHRRRIGGFNLQRFAAHERVGGQRRRDFRIVKRTKRKKHISRRQR